MKKHTMFLFAAGILFSVFLKAQNHSEGVSTNYNIPQNVQQLLQQIKTAEDNEDWNAYYSLRPQLISAWQHVSPEAAALYRTTNSPEADMEDPAAPYEVENQPEANLRWGTDLLVYSGAANDMSLAITRADTLYLGVLDKAANRVSIYRSPNGETWTPFKTYTVSPSSKIELLDFDGFHGSTGPSYLLLFTLYDDGNLWCTRISLTDGVSTNSKVVNTGCNDFSVDRSFPSTFYRCFVHYDSAATQFRKRSDPSSYGTIWQDPYQISNCGDPDIAYGYNGSLYLAYTGNSSHNLYVLSHYNYGDPSVGGTQTTLASGTTDTTSVPEVIATRKDTASQIVDVVYNQLLNGRPVLYYAEKRPGAGWSKELGWVSTSNVESKYAELFCRKANNDSIFQSVFVRSGLGNALPREIRYKKYQGGWNTSAMISDSSRTPTGLNNAVVVSTSTGDVAYAYIGTGAVNVYFDRSNWVVTSAEKSEMPQIYSLEQNYPNPFNPNTVIRFSVPEMSNVSLKVYNIIGQQVAELLNKEMTSGTHEVNFSAGSLPSGVYIYKLQAGSYTCSRKMTLLK